MVKNAAEIFSVLERGSLRRAKAETLLNKQVIFFNNNNFLLFNFDFI